MAEREKTPVHVSARHVRVPEDLLVYAQAKGERLSRFDRRVRRVDVILGLEGKSAAVEIVVHVGGTMTRVGRTEAADGWAAVDQAFAKAEKQVKRTKERRRDTRQRRTKA